MKKVLALTLAAALMASPCLAKKKKKQADEYKPSYVHQQVGDSIVYLEAMPMLHMTVLYDDQAKEIPLCLHGRDRGKMIYIDDLVMPQLLDADEESAKYDNSNCLERSDYLGMAHNHPNGLNQMSQVDFDRFVEDRRAVLEVIVYGAEKQKGLGYSTYVKRYQPTGFQPLYIQR